MYASLNQFMKCFYVKYPLLIASVFPFNSFADCGASGGEISSPTTASCTVSDDDSLLTVNSSTTAPVSFNGANQKLIIGSDGTSTIAAGAAVHAFAK